MVQRDSIKRTLLELVLWLEGNFRRRLTPIRVTPLQAGILLFVRRHSGATQTKVATALCLKAPTVSGAMESLVRGGWLLKRYSIEDRRAVCLSLSRRGSTLVRQIEPRVRRMEATLVKTERRALGMRSPRTPTEPLAP
jgi:DNA-binding MarR family transcriptional regulator